MSVFESFKCFGTILAAGVLVSLCATGTYSDFAGVRFERIRGSGNCTKNQMTRVCKQIVQQQVPQDPNDPNSPMVTVEVETCSQDNPLRNNPSNSRWPLGYWASAPFEAKQCVPNCPNTYLDPTLTFFEQCNGVSSPGL